MYTRALLIWIGLAVVLTLLGFVRPLALEPEFGTVGAQFLVAGVSLLAVLGASLLLARILPVANPSQFQRIGVLWLGLTLLLEVVGGLLIVGIPPAYMLSNYDIFAGRLWPVVLAGIVLIPILVGRRRGEPRRG